MGLDHYSLKEWLMVCRLAEEKCERLFRAVATLLPERDHDVRRLLQSLADEEANHRRELERFSETVAWPPMWSLDRQSIGNIVDRFFPSTARPVEGEDAERTGALRLAGDLERESVRFYLQLAERVSEPEARRFFRGMAEKESRHQNRLEEEVGWAI